MPSYNKKIILIDEPLENDHRVLTTIKTYKNAIVIDCLNLYSIKTPFHINIISNFFLLFKTLMITPSFWIKLYKEYKVTPNKIFDGLNRSMKTRYKSTQIAKKIITTYGKDKIDLIHAHDFMCGMIGEKLALYYKTNLTYEAHELEFHRNRKNSLLRVVFDSLSEIKIIKAANKIIVVNQPIKIAYIGMYKIPVDKIHIVDNNHFEQYHSLALNHFDTNNIGISIIYVGSGINNRKLEILGIECSKTEADVQAFFLSEIPKVAYTYNWTLGSKNYLPELIAIIKKQTTAMWCCSENICLSYQLGLSNKFFQAIALCTPVIVYKNTYLARIVAEHNLGYIYNDNNFKEIIKQLNNSKKHYDLLKSVSKFQKKLINKEIVL